MATKPDLSALVRRDDSAGAVAIPASKGKPTPNLEALTRRNEAVTQAIHAGSSIAYPGTGLRVSDLEPGKCYSLPLSMFRRSSIGARIKYHPEEVDALIESLQANKQLTPALGYVEGEYVAIVDGGKRFSACTQGGIPELLVYIQKGPEGTLNEYIQSFVANHQRTRQTAFDDAARFGELLEKGLVVNQTELARLLNIPQATMTKTLVLSRIPDRERRNMIDHISCFPLSIAYEIAVLYGNESGMSEEERDALVPDLIKTIIDQELSFSAVRALIAQKRKGKSRRVRAETVPVIFGDSKGLVKSNPTKGEYSVQFRGLTPEAMSELDQKLKALFN